jgi:hypothetical protein
MKNNITNFLSLSTFNNVNLSLELLEIAVESIFKPSYFFYNSTETGPKSSDCTGYLIGISAIPSFLVIK